MLFLFDNNGINYWLHNNINDCCDSSVSYNNENKELELELELESEMPTIKQKSNVKNNYKQNKNNLITEKYKYTNINYNSNYNSNYNINYNSNYNKKWENTTSSTYKNTAQKTQYNNKKDKYSLLGSHERPKLIDL